MIRHTEIIQCTMKLTGNVLYNYDNYNLCYQYSLNEINLQYFDHAKNDCDESTDSEKESVETTDNTSRKVFPHFGPLTDLEEEEGDTPKLRYQQTFLY